MQSDASPCTFRGHGTLFFLNTSLYLIGSAAVLSLLMLGIHGWRLFLLATGALLPIVISMAAIVSLTDRFFFDDVHSRVVRSLGTSIPYDRIKGIQVRQTGNLVRVSLDTGWLAKPTLILALHLREKDLLLKELTDRLPGARIHAKTFADGKVMISLLSILSCLTIVAHAYLTYRFPELRIEPRRVAWLGAQEPTQQVPRYYLGTFVFSLPERFIAMGDIEGRLLFRDRVGGTAVVVSYRTPGQDMPGINRFFLASIGMRDYFDLVNISYQSRFGLLPLVMKRMELSGFSETALYYDDQFQMRGLVTQGIRNNEQEAQVLVAGAGGAETLQFLITGGKKVEEKMLKEIVGSIHLQTMIPSI